MIARCCAFCGTAYAAKLSTSRFCSDRCRKRNERTPRDALSVSAPSSTAQSELVEAARRELGAVGQADTPLGQMALVLAGRIASGSETGAATAALSKELRAVMARVTREAPVGVDPVDELRARRARRPAEWVSDE